MDFAFCEDIFLGFKGFARAGLYAPPHIHPQANKWFYGIEGEAELPDGTKVEAKGVFGFLPKGATETGNIVSKEIPISSQVSE